MKRLAYLLLCLSLGYCTCAFAQVASFTVDKSEGCDLLRAHFDASSSTGDAPLKYIWDFDNGNDPVTETSTIASAIFNAPGVYNVKLIVEDADGNRSAPVINAVNVYDSPNADFSVSGTLTGCAPLTLIFNDRTTEGDNPVTEWLWEFGDGSTSTEQNPEKTYTSTGSFDISLYVTDSKGCESNYSMDNMVNTTSSINFEIEADNPYTCDDANVLTTTFNPGLRYGTSLSTYNYLWDFGDGSTDTAATPTHNFTAGSYDVTLTVSTKDGICNVTQTYPGFINVGKVTPTISYGNTYPVCGRPRHKFSLEGFGVGENQKVIWEFGDGTTDTVIGSSSVDHQYSESGVYTVNAYITDPNDPTCLSVSTADANIDIPVSTFTADNRANCNSGPITFSAPDIWDADSYIWYFGDGTTSIEKDPVHTYTSDGTYDVTLKVITRNAGCKLTFTEEDFIHVGKPEASFSTNGRDILYDMPIGYDLSGLPTTHLEGGCLSDVVNFNATVKGNIDTYEWIFGDGTTETTTDPRVSHYYTSSGEFSPELIVTDEQGCTDTFQCNDCVRRGEENNNADVTIYSDGDIVNNVDDTICCFYNFLFENETDPDEVDLIWYYLELIGDLPPAFAGFYEEGGKFYSYEGVETDPDILDMMYVLASFSEQRIGDDPNLHYHAYEKGCPTKVEYPKFVHHRLPWGNFLYEPPECEPNVDPNADTIVFDLNDTTAFQGDWLAEENYPLDSVIIGVQLPGYGSYTYRRSDYGILNLAQLQQINAFPVIKIPATSAPAMFMVTTTIYDSDPEVPNGFKKPPAALDECGPPGPACFDQVPIPIITSGINVNVNTSVNVDKGCIPLTVEFNIDNLEAVRADSSLSWIFSNGETADGPNPTVTFIEPDTIYYKLFGYDSAGCTIDSTFIRDTIIAYGIKPGFMLDSTALCLTDTLLSSTNITNVSTSTGTITENKWDMADYKDTIINQGAFSFTFPPESAPPPHLQMDGKYIVLTVKDDQGCQAKDSAKIYLRKPEPAFIFGEKHFGCRAEAYLNLEKYSLVGGVPPVYGELHWEYEGDTTHNSKNLRQAHGTQIFIKKGFEGEYTARVEITGDSLGRCPAIGKDTIFNITLDSIVPDFDISKTTFECPPAVLQLDHESTELIDSVPIEESRWRIYDVNGNIVATSLLKSPTFSISQGGYFDIELEVEDENGCSSTLKRDSVVFVKSLDGEITLPADTICMGESKIFSGNSDAATYYTWDFGEGTVYDGKEIEYAFSQAGNRIVRLILSQLNDDNNLECEETVQDSIYVKLAPVLTLNDTAICLGDTITLHTPDSSFYDHSWMPSGATTPNILVSDSGLYIATVTDQLKNCSSTDSIYLKVNSLPEVTIITTSPVCAGEEIMLEAGSFPPAIAYVWQKDGALFDTSAAPTMVLNNQSLISLTITDTNQCKNSAELLIDIIEKPVLDIEDQVICPGDSTIADGTPVNQDYPNGKYMWYFDSSVLPDSLSKLLIREEGNYVLKFSVGSCISTDTFDAEHHPLPDVTKNEELVIFCQKFEEASLDAGIAHSYLWQNGETGQFLTTSQEGTYYVTLTSEHGCENLDSIILENRCAPIIRTPDAFIPGQAGDDKFYINMYNVGKFHLYIFNRWGEIIFESKHTDEFWDGTYKGEDMPPGVYPWVIRYTGDNEDYDETIEIQGSVTIIR